MTWPVCGARLLSSYTSDVLQVEPISDWTACIYFYRCSNYSLIETITRHVENRVIGAENDQRKTLPFQASDITILLSYLACKSLKIPAVGDSRISAR